MNTTGNIKMRNNDRFKNLVKAVPINFVDANYYYSRVLQEVARKTGGAFAKPTYVIFLLTHHCNARCLHCESYNVPTPEHEMTTDEWKNTLDEARDWLGPIDVSFTGGEALLRPDAIELVEHAAMLGFQVELLTNGFPVFGDRAARLAHSGLKRVTMSVDGSTRELHERTRNRKGFYERVISALSSFVSERDAHNLDIEIWAKTAIMNINVNDLPNIARLAKEIGITGVKYQALEPTYYTEQLDDPKWYLKNPLWVTNLNDVSNSIKELKALKAEGYPILNSNENLDLIENYFRDPEGLAFKVHAHEYSKKKPECRDWLGTLQIMPDGGMKMCYRMEPFANARQGSLKKAWMKRAKCWQTDCGYI